VREFAKQLHARTGVDLVVADDIGGRVSCDVVDVPWFALLQHVAVQLRFDVVGCGSVLALRRRQTAPERPRVVLKSVDKPASEVFAWWAARARTTVFVDPAGKGIVSVLAFKPDQQGLLTAVARAVGCDVAHDEGEIVSVRPSTKTERMTTFTAEHMTARELAELCGEKSELPAPATDSAATMTLFADNADVADVLAAIAAVTERPPAKGGDGPTPK
jgi:hypothetical protein